MTNLVMHTDGKGARWAMTQCRMCGEMHKYLAADAISRTVSCKSCKHPMELQDAVIAAGGGGVVFLTDNERHEADGAAPA